jgi:hypothetical protein
VANFQDLYPQLVAGKVDFFTALQRTPERASLLVFPEHAGVAGWGQLFIAEDAEIDTVLDLQHQRIGVVAEDQTGGNFRAYIDSLAIPCEIVEFPTSSSWAGRSNPAPYSAESSPTCSWPASAGEAPRPWWSPPSALIRSCPAKPFGESLRCGDPPLRRTHADPESYYYELQAKWFGREPVETVVALCGWSSASIGFFAIALVCVLVIGP